MKKFIHKFLISIILLYSFSLHAQTNCINFNILQSDIGPTSETFGVSLADFNNDGFKDVVIIDAYDEIEVYFYDPVLGKMDTTALNLGDNAWRFGVEVIDIENDGDWDFITSPFSTSSGNGMEVWENDGHGAFSLKADGVGGSASGHEFAVGDLNGDGFTDIFFPHGDIDILLNDGHGVFISNGQNDLSLSSPEAVVLADLDADGDLDASVVTGSASGKIYLNDGDGQFTATTQVLSADDEGIDAADIDGDGDLDLVIAPWHGSVKIYLNDGLAHFSPGDTLNEVSEFFDDIALEDMNYDGYPDIITTNRMWLNDATNPGNFILQDFDIGVSTHDFQVTDINNDGFLDIYVGRFSAQDGDNIYIQNPGTVADEEATICAGDSLFLENAWQTETGVYIDNVGCENYTRTFFSILNEINTEIILIDGFTIMVIEIGANYQWLDCENNYSPINGATAQNFAVPYPGGDYAVEITNGSCIDTSSCYHLVYLDIEENDFGNLSIYPNPTNGILSIEGTQTIETVKVIDITGRVLISQTKSAEAFTIDLSSQPAGVYFINLRTGEAVLTRKIIKQ